MKFITKINILLFLLFLSINTKAQDRPAREKIESLKIAFITEKLSLSEAEAKEFWPIYSDYFDKLRQARKAKRWDKNTDINEMSDKEIETFLDSRIAAEEKEVQLKKIYLTKLKAVLPVKKIALLLKAERQFKEEMLRRYKQRNEK